MNHRIPELQRAVIEAAKAYADAVNLTDPHTRPNDGRLITAVWALQRAEEQQAEQFARLDEQIARRKEAQLA